MQSEMSQFNKPQTEEIKIDQNNSHMRSKQSNMLQSFGKGPDCILLACW